MSAVQVQLQFFKTKEQCEIEHLFGQISKIGTSSEKVRRGLYAKLGELKKRQDDIDERLKILEKNICLQE